jgi:general stress protein 26
MSATQQMPTPRSLDERRNAAIELLESNHQLWLATGSDGHGAHLIPVAYAWDGAHLIMATFESSRTTANLRSRSRARAAIGEPTNLVMIDGDVTLIDPADMDPAAADRYACVSFDPRALPGLVYLSLVPTQMQVWNGFHEFHGRTVMRDGQWLDEPADPALTLPAWMSVA